MREVAFALTFRSLFDKTVSVCYTWFVVWYVGIFILQAEM